MYTATKQAVLIDGIISMLISTGDIFVGAWFGVVKTFNNALLLALVLYRPLHPGHNPNLFGEGPLALILVSILSTCPAVSPFFLDFSISNVQLANEARYSGETTTKRKKNFTFVMYLVKLWYLPLQLLW